MKRIGLLAAALLALVARPAAAAFPDHPIQVVIAYGAGGPADMIARVLGPCMTAHLGQPVVIINRVGANGDIAALAVRQARPDGHTLLVHSSAMSITAALAETPAYDVLRDFAPIMKVSVGIQGVYVSAATPANNLQGLIARVRSNPGSLNYGSVGVGSVNQLATEALSGAAGLNMVHVTYAQGTPAMLTGLMTNDIQFVMTDLSGAQAALESGRIRLLTLHARERLAWRPEIPTLAEIVPEMTPFIGMLWYGYLAPAGTPAPIVKQLSDTLEACMADPETHAGLRRAGYEEQQLVAQPTEPFRASFEPEIARLRELGRRGNIVLR